MKRLCPTVFCGILSLVAAAEITTNDVMENISVPTVWAHITNTVRTTADVAINANLTLEDRTFYRFAGNGNISGRRAVISVAPGEDDVLVTIQGNSGFFPAYRNSGHSANAWRDIGLDPWNKNTPSCYYDIRLGVKDGAGGSTGQAKFLLKTNPSFGENSSFPLMARYFYVSSSVKANPESGYVDFLEVDSAAMANISRIEVEGTTPARILFHDGCRIHRDNATAVNTDGTFAPKTGATLVLDSADGKRYLYHKQFGDMNFTARLGGVVVVRGVDFALHSAGPYCEGSPNGWNYKRFLLSAADNVRWEITGDLYLIAHSWLQMEGDDLLPHGPNTGRLVIEPSGTQQKYAPDQLVYSCLDLNGTLQYVNGVNTSGNGWNSGVITNTSPNTGWVVLGKDDVPGSFHIHCAPRVAVKKIGEGALAVNTADGEELVLEGGTSSFLGVNIFTNLTVKAGAVAMGDVTVLGSFTAEEGSDVSLLRMSLGGAATMNGFAEVYSLSRDGAYLDAGLYAEADWLAEGASVRVLRKPGEPACEIIWQGGESTSASVPSNWRGGLDAPGLFNIYHYLMKLAATDAATDTLTLDGGVYRLLGMTFDAPGDFTVITNSADDRLEISGPVTVAAPPAIETREYTVAAPVKLVEDLDIAIHTNTTLRFTGSLSGTGGIRLVADKVSDLAKDFAETGTLELVNARISGKIDHQEGGVLLLRGDVGVPGIGSQGALVCDYMRYRNGSNSSDGAVVPGYLRLDGVHVYKPFTVYGQGQVDAKQNYWCVALAGTTNTFEALAHLDVSTTLNGEAGSVYIFNNQVEVPGGSFNPSGMSQNKRTLFYFNGPVVVSSKSRAFAPGTAAHVVFNAKGNKSALYYHGQSSFTEFTVDDAFDDTLFELSGTVDELRLNDTHQRMVMLMSGSPVNYVAQGNKIQGKVKGTLGAVIEVTGGAVDWEGTSVTNCGVKFMEGVSLAKSGAGIMRMIGSLEHSSTGSVAVTGGMLAFDANVSWPYASSVMVAGQGTLKLSDGDTFNGARTELHLGAQSDAWRIDLPAGVSQRFTAAYDADGRMLPSGTYGNAASGARHQTYAEHFIGNGTISVARHGTQIILR